ncbi:hypothetical protein BGZ60DRAFT_522453 [Tricladium varicosporioides]|nr:hypothetical protein BGZ60DRAFT_522453 [Hymenoscyphus varicosporioides]
MSFTSVALHQLNKNANLSGQGYEELDSDFFNQFLNFSPPHSNGGDYSVTQESHGYERSVTNSSIETLSSHDEGNLPKNHSWEGDTWAKSISAASFSTPSQGNGLYSELSGRAAISDSELLNLEGIKSTPHYVCKHSQISLPSTPSPAAATTRRKAQIAGSISKSFKEAAGKLEKSLRSSIQRPNSPSRMRNHGQKNRSQVGNKLNEHVLKFELDFEDPTALFPPAKVSENYLMEDIIKEGYPFSMPSILRKSSGLAADDTPPATPELVHSRNTSYQQPEEMYPTTPELQISATSWPQVASSPGPLAEDMEAPVWWNHASQVPMAQPLPTGFHINPQLATKSLAHQLQTGLAFNANNSSRNEMNMMNGLMIQMPKYPSNQSFVVEGSSINPQQGYLNAFAAQRYHHCHTFHTHTSSSQPRRSQMRNNRSIDSTYSPSPPPHPHSKSTFYARKHRSPKTKCSTPRIPPSLSAVDFVNFTPSDSKKILTGVAPSGSSKTKARREKEAIEKRRKLSQAAVKAVKAAGGDVDSLVEQGLIE